MDRERLVEEAAIERRVAAGIVGPLSTLALAGALVPLRDTLGVANVGFLTILVVLLAAAEGGRAAGILTAVVGALAFNYFHTQPYLTFSVAAREDAIGVVLCGLVGLIVGEVGHRLAERTREARRARARAGAVDELVAAAAGFGIDPFWKTAKDVLARSGVTSCSYRSSRIGATAADADGGPPADSAELARTFAVTIGRPEAIGVLYVTVDPDAVGRESGTLVRTVAHLLELRLSVTEQQPDRLD